MSVLTIITLEAKIHAQAETIKGLDRATVHNTACFARLEEIINTQDKTIEQKDATIKDLQERLDYHLEADAGRPIRDINGTIEAQAKRIRNQQAVIKQYRTEMQALQRKVQEQDEKLKQWNDYFDKEQP